MAGVNWARRLSRLSLGLAIVALSVAFVGVTLARYDIIAKLPGFSALLVGMLIALVSLVTGLAGLVLTWRYSASSHRAALTGLLLSAAFVGYLASWPLAAGGAPSIHDVTTDLSNPPEFKVLALREDNLTGVGTLENWRRIHGRAYGDLKPLTIAKPVAAVIADAERIARERGWEIATADPVGGRLEATANVAYIRFKDDVVIRVARSTDGLGSIVDMRSVSRVGGGDLGVVERDQGCDLRCAFGGLR